ncbi:MAG: hypothetical protein AB7K24_22985 [Gemmataceae bacterium]
MDDLTRQTLENLAEKMGKLLEELAPRQAEFKSNPMAFFESEHFKPIQEAANQTKGLLEQSQQELITRLEAFKAREETKLEQLLARQAERDAARRQQEERAAYHFRASDHGMPPERIEQLIDDIFSHFTLRTDKTSTDWTNW